MTDIDEVAQGIYHLETNIPGVQTVFAVYFIKGSSAAIIEPGPATMVPTVQAAVKKLALTDLVYIIPTHIHLDHAGGLGNLVQIFPQVKAVVNPQGARHVVDPSRLIRSTRMSFGDDFENYYGSILPVPEARLKIVQDGERLTVGDRELMVIHTPGHAPHHISLFDTKTRGLFSGEALGLIYSPGAPPLPAVTPPSFDPDAYRKDWQRLRELKPEMLFYSHGTVGKDPEKLIAAIIENAKKLSDAILHVLKQEKSEESVIHTMGEYVRKEFGATLAEYDLTSVVRAHIFYFKKMGLA